ncbi:MAG: hypothetical protein Fues2KO_13230 [Fuerstiella sp.]
MTALLVGLVVATSFWYISHASLPNRVVIAGGPENGRYAVIAEGVAQELRGRWGLQVEVLHTGGSLENLRLLEQHKADIGLYQPGTRQILLGAEQAEQEVEPAQFVSNLFSEFLIPVGTPAERKDLADVRQLKLACNDRTSGDFAATQLLLHHLGVNPAAADVSSIAYTDLPTALKTQQIDAAVLCCSLQAPILKQVLDPQVGQLLPVPSVDALALKSSSVKAATIPNGYFGTSPTIPDQDFRTVAFRAQLLADSEASVRLIEEVTAIVTDSRFQRRLELNELFAGGTDYATARPEYPMHPGASHIHFPGLKPLLNPDFVEGTEGIRSFVVSLVAAIWLLARWWKKREMRSQEHRLDRYVHDLLQLERDQMDVDGENGTSDLQQLQKMLDQVTELRQEALSEFTAHELNEDRAVDCFIEMCHALSDKINAKLTRATLISLGSSPKS